MLTLSSVAIPESSSGIISLDLLALTGLHSGNSVTNFCNNGQDAQTVGKKLLAFEARASAFDNNLASKGRAARSVGTRI